MAIMTCSTLLSAPQAERYVLNDIVLGIYNHIGLDMQSTGFTKIYHGLVEQYIEGRCATTLYTSPL